MTLSRIELDGIGSPAAIADRIHALDPGLALDFRIEDLCRRLDINRIESIDTAAFEAALIMDTNKAFGSILLAKSSHARRKRFSIGHELGHFLIPTHRPHEGERFTCSLADLRQADTREKDRHKRVEAEANRFAAQLLMPPSRIRTNCSAHEPDLLEIVRLAEAFKVSKEAMARSYIDAIRDDVAIVILRHGRIDRVYRPDGFPWIAPARGLTVPNDSIAANHGLRPGQASEMVECDPNVWFDERNVEIVDVLSEQVLSQRDGWAMLLLHAELKGGV